MPFAVPLDQPVRVGSLRVTPRLFPVLGVRPELGQFFTVDPATGATLANLAAPGYDMEALAFDPNTGTVYGIGDNTSLSAYDPVAGTWSVVGDTGLNWDSGGLAFDPNANVLYAVAFAQGTGLYTINPATAVPTLVGNNLMGVVMRGGLATAY